MNLLKTKATRFNPHEGGFLSQRVIYVYFERPILLSPAQNAKGLT